MKRFVKPESSPNKTLLIICIGAILMVCVDVAHNYMNSRAVTPPVPESVIIGIEHSEVEDFKTAEEISAEMSPAGMLTEEIYKQMPQPDPVVNDLSAADDDLAAVDVKTAPVVPEDEVEVAALPPKPTTGASGPGRVVIIIDDLGMDRKHSNEIIDIDAPLTLAFLPYASNLDEITARALKNGHELLIHMPMEALNTKMNPGPIALRSGMDEGEVEGQLEQAFNSFDGYIGINNHMGSKVTQDEPILHVVMEQLAQRDLAFVDSKTISTSIAGDIAAEHGLDYAERDVFLDHEDNIAFVRGALKRLEQVARANGSAIAIGHPKAATIQALKEWIPTLESKNITIVPVSAVLKKGAPKHGAIASGAIKAPPPQAFPAAFDIEPASGMELKIDGLPIFTPYGPVSPPSQPPE